MLSLQLAPLAQPARLAAPRQKQRRCVVVAAAAAPAQEPRHECPLLQEAVSPGAAAAGRRAAVQGRAFPAPWPHHLPLLAFTPQAVCGKTSCVHPGRPVGQACADCPRKKGKAVAMAKKKCVHPDRPISVSRLPSCQGRCCLGRKAAAWEAVRWRRPRPAAAVG